MQGCKDLGTKDARIWGPRMQGCKDAGSKDAGTQGCKDARIQGCKDTGTQGCRDQGCKDASIEGDLSVTSPVLKAMVLDAQLLFDFVSVV